VRQERIFTRGFALVLSASLFYSLGFQLPGAALPLYAASLGANETQIGLLIGCFALMALLGRTVVAWQLDHGRRRSVLAVGTAIFVVSAVGYAVTTTVLPLLGLRLLNGSGHAAGQTASQTLATEHAPPARRGEALGMQALMLTLALAVAPAAGVALAQRAGYATLFLTAAAFSAVATVLAVLIPRRQAPRGAGRIRLFNPAVTRPGLILLALMVSFGAMVSLAAVHAARTGLPNPGLIFLTYALGMGLVQVTGGRLPDRRGRGAAILPGLALAALGVWAIAAAHSWWLLPALAIFGLGIGLAQSNLLALAADYVAPQQRGSALATAGMFQEAGISSGATLAGLIGQAAGLPVAFALIGLLPAAALLVLVVSPAGRAVLQPPGGLIEAGAVGQR
jgi:MFS family permease